MKRQTLNQATLPVLAVVGLDEHQKAFRAARHGMDMVFLGGCRELRQYLMRDPLTTIVVTAASLRDGNWCDVLACLLQAENPPVLILCAPGADEKLWSEAIWRGVHDILTAPPEPTDVANSIASACRSRASGASLDEGRCMQAVAG